MMLACLLKGDDERGWRLMSAVVVVTDVVSVGKHEVVVGCGDDGAQQWDEGFVGDGY